MSNSSQNQSYDIFDGYDEKTCDEALDKHLSAAQALGENTITNVPQNVRACLDVGLDLMGLVADDQSKLIALPNIDKDLIAEFATLRMALWQTGAQLLIALSGDQKSRLVNTAKELRAMRTQMFAIFGLVWPSDKAKQQFLAEIRKGSGYADLSQDCLALVGQIKEHKKDILEFVQEKPLDELLKNVEKLAPRIVEWRHKDNLKTQVQSAELLHNQIFSLYQQRFNLLAKAGRYLFDEVDNARYEAYAPFNKAYLRALRSERK